MLKAETNTSTVYYTRGFELISRREGATASFYIYDGGLSVRALTNEAGTVTDTLVFDAFGNETTKTGPSDNSYGFQGEEQDATGLYYLRARYMDPATGTFTTMDTYGGSLSDPMSLHKYLFANSNPVMYCDPSGHSTSLNEVNSVVGIMTILASASTVVVYNIIGDIYGADKTQPSYWIGMVVAVILVAVLTYFTAGAFVEGIAICALGKILIGIMGLITANICCNLSNEARVKGYELYGDIFEFASVLLQTYAFTELLEGIAEGWNSLKEKISNAWQPNKHGAVYVGDESNHPNNATNEFNPPKIYKDRRGNLTNGTYTISQSRMLPHLDGTENKSHFFLDIDADKAVLDAAAYADEYNLWKTNTGNPSDFTCKATVDITNGPIGITGSGEYAYQINVYRTATGLVHGCPT